MHAPCITCVLGCVPNSGRWEHHNIFCQAERESTASWTPGRLHCMLDTANLAVVNDAVEEGAGREVGQRRGGGRVHVQAFWGQQHQGLREGPVHLAPQHVEQLGRGAGRGHAQVALPLGIAASVLHHQGRPVLLPGTLMSVHAEVGGDRVAMANCSIHACMHCSCHVHAGHR